MLNFWAIPTIFSISMINENTNPVKASITLFLLASSLTTLTSLEMGLVWFQMILMILFTGGILIMFMILSTFSPNQKMKMKLTKKSIIIMAILTILWLNFNKISPSLNIKNVKMYFQNLNSSLTSMMVMTMYFCMFIKILKKEKNSMRSTSC